MKVYLRIVGDTTGGTLHASKADAVKAFEEPARKLAKFGQQITAELHYVNSDGEWSDYPDFVVALDAADNAVCVTL